MPRGMGLSFSLVVIALLTLPLRADSLTIVGGLTFGDLHVDRIENDHLFYTLSGESRDKPLAQIVTMSLDDEPDFSAAESAFQNKQWDKATDRYLHAITSTSKEWLKDWIAPRLLQAAAQANRFDASVVAWIRLVNHDPDSAAANRPAIPLNPGPTLATAARELEDAAKLSSGKVRHQLLEMLLDVQTARQDTLAADAVAKALADNQPLSPIAAIDPAHQADGLFQAAQAAQAKADTANNLDDWKDAALAYLRVYVHFRGGPAAVHSPASLLKAAQIEQLHLHEPVAALTLYQKVITEYKDSAEARQAASDMTRIGTATH